MTDLLIRLGTALSMLLLIALPLFPPAGLPVGVAEAHDVAGCTPTDSACYGNIVTTNPASVVPWNGGVSPGQESVNCVAGEWHWNIKSDANWPSEIHVKFSDGIGWVAIQMDAGSPNNGGIAHYTKLTNTLTPSSAYPVEQARYNGVAPTGSGAHFNFSHGPCKTTPQIATTPNPSTAKTGDTLNDSATITGVAGVDPTGSVTFKLYAPSATPCSGDPVYTQTVTIATDGTLD
ncbi:MAG: hypothetical protein AAB289_07605, partial [Chloroflexota bacterium]